MTKPQSYPFMAIAKRYGLDYGDVLAIAHYGRFEDARNGLTEDAFNYPLEALNEIARANDEFKAIQAGKIDWQTGNQRYGGTLKDFQAQGRALRKPPEGVSSGGEVITSAELLKRSNRPEVREAIRVPRGVHDPFAPGGCDCPKCHYGLKD